MFSKWFKQRSTTPSIAREVWEACLEQMAFLGCLSRAQRDRLIDLADQFVKQKDFSGTHGFVITDQVKSVIALQACLPILRLGLEAYADFVEIVVYPDRFVTPRSYIDEAGVVHESIDELSGETMQGGPIVLAWPDAAPELGADGMSVVIHEFVHKLDLLDGEDDGVPPLPPSLRAHWAVTLDREYERFCSALDTVERSIPVDIDPESEAADPYYALLPFDPYAATDHAEFFAVSAEAFFTIPDAFAQEFPDLARLYAEYFGYPLGPNDHDRQMAP